MCQIPQIRFQIYLVSSVLPIQFKTTSLVIKVIFNSFVNNKKKKKKKLFSTPLKTNSSIFEITFKLFKTNSSSLTKTYYYIINKRANYIINPIL